MKAKYITKGNEQATKVLEYPVIMPQAMQHSDGFMLLGFADWEAVNDEKLSAAVTNVVEFHIENDKTNVGFRNEN